MMLMRLLLIKFKIFIHMLRLHPNHYLLLGLKEIVIQVVYIKCTQHH